MRGRKNHGKRQLLWGKRRARYVKRQQRARRIHHNNGWPGPAVSRQNKQWPYRFKGTGNKQPPGKVVYVKGFKHWAQYPGTVFYAQSVAHVGKHKVYHMVLTPTARQSGRGHGWGPSFGFHGGQRSRVMYRGHKIGRLNGTQRKAWGAYRYHWAWMRNGFDYWPSWDPQGRTPVGP